ncbi:pilus assembly protein [Lysobacter soli]|uniref:pilus assembly protein n=1 Tax=Lysobacter soli TaxID=453783 RepID=UPI0037C71B74
MNTKNKKTPMSSRAPLAAFIATLLALPVHAATSFPDYPLQTGTNSVAPNILFILDDSGSMEWRYMYNPNVSSISYNGGNDTSSATGDNRSRDNSNTPTSSSTSAMYDLSAATNTMYYNPEITYEPWIGADGKPIAGGTAYDKVYSSAENAGPGESTTSLFNNNVYYYVPTAAGVDLTQATSYYRFQIPRDGTDIQRCKYTRANNRWGWNECTPATPTLIKDGSQRSNDDERKNFATWYSFHRTRMKLAKAGASRAFGDVDNVRMGFRSLHNNASGNFDIPVQTNDGKFETDNRTKWYQSLLSAKPNNGTPLRSALDSAGQYFSRSDADGPYGPNAAAAEQLACRQNFTVLTTDGYWNGDSNFSMDNFDGTDATDKIESPNKDIAPYLYKARAPYTDTLSNTLADVAMKYWRTDLRTDLPNTVPRATSGDAFWQHMITFGISIGLKGTLDQSSVDEVIAQKGVTKGGRATSWPTPSADSTNNIDDLLHAAVNGHGEFIAATDSDKFYDAVKEVLGKIDARRASGSNVATNSTSFQSNTRAYQATYMSGEWTGDMLAYDVTINGIAATPAWKLSEQVALPANKFSERGVYTWSGTDGTTFPTKDQTTALKREGVAAVEGSDNADYIKGKQTLEESKVGGKLRTRTGLIGDIVNSSPFYVKESESIFIGANDGMMHAIDALTGKVRFSYVPAGLDMAALASLSKPQYEHRFFVDGPISVSAYRQTADKNYLVGTLGRGGKGAYALDVTNPSTFGSQKVLWDKTLTTDKDMGYILGAPLITKGNNNQDIAIVANGIDSENGKAVLYVYNLTTGAELIKLDTGVAGGNGMSTPRGADLNGDGKVDYVYAGDLKGNVWKFDMRATVADSWSISGSAPFFTTGANQPISGGLALARDPVNRNNIWIAFGTGRLISDGDITTTDTQRIYGLMDNGSAIGSHSELQQRTIALVSDDGKYRAFEKYSALPTNKRGWYVNLGKPTEGERVVSGPRINGRALWISSIIPEAGKGCESGGTGYLNALDLFTGTSGGDDSGSTSYIDANGDGNGKNDNIGTGDNQLPIGSVNLGVGMPTESNQIDNLVLVCGSDGKCGTVKTPPGGGTPKRLSWRELYNRE